MKRLTAFILTVLVMLSLTACGGKAPLWQEQYDLGMRYLSEGNYEEAILAFAAAIEIDPLYEENAEEIGKLLEEDAQLTAFFAPEVADTLTLCGIPFMDVFLSSL